MPSRVCACTCVYMSVHALGLASPCPRLSTRPFLLDVQPGRGFHGVVTKTGIQIVDTGSRRGRVGPGAFPALGIQEQAWACGFFSSFLQGYFKMYGILSQALLPFPGGATRDASSRTWREDSSLCMCWNRDPGSGTCRRGLSRTLASRGSGTEVWLGFQTAFPMTPKFCLLDWPEIPPLEFYSFGYSRKVSVHLLELASESLTSGSEGVS